LPGPEGSLRDVYRGQHHLVLLQKRELVYFIAHAHAS
jgi:hypothetical protein